jgi:hypothetical protein
MNDTFAVHVFQDITHLIEEETATVLAHSSQTLTDIEKKASSNKLKENVN